MTPKWYSFRLTTKDNEVIVEKNISEHGVTNARVAFSARHSYRTKHRYKILCYYFDLKICLHNCNRLVCCVCGNALERFVVKVVKMLGFRLVEIARVMMFSCL